MVHHAEMKWFTQRSPSSQPIAWRGEPLARLTHCAAKLAWLCRFHAKAAACTRCWELVGPCDNQSLWAPLSSWDRLRGIAGQASALYSDRLRHSFFPSDFCLCLFQVWNCGSVEAIIGFDNAEWPKARRLACSLYSVNMLTRSRPPLCPFVARRTPFTSRRQ